MPDVPSNDAPTGLISDVEFGEGVVVYSFTNLYGCRIGDGTRIGPFVEIQAGALIGARCKIAEPRVRLRRRRDRRRRLRRARRRVRERQAPRATNAAGELAGADDWELVRVVSRTGVDRLERDDRRPGDDRPRRDRRRGRGGDARRRARRGRGREPGAAARRSRRARLRSTSRARAASARRTG